MAQKTDEHLNVANGRSTDSYGQRPGNDTTPENHELEYLGSTAPCPMCDEDIKLTAKRCKHCSYELSDDEIEQNSQIVKDQQLYARQEKEREESIARAMIESEQFVSNYVLEKSGQSGIDDFDATKVIEAFYEIRDSLTLNTSDQEVVKRLSSHTTYNDKIIASVLQYIYEAEEIKMTVQS